MSSTESVSSGPCYRPYGCLSGRVVHAQTSCCCLTAEEDKLAQGNRGQETSISKNLSVFFLLGRGSDYLLSWTSFTCPIQPELRAGTWMRQGRQEQDVPHWVVQGKSGKLASPGGRGHSADTEQATSPPKPPISHEIHSPWLTHHFHLFQTSLSMDLSPKGVPTLNPCSMGCCSTGVHDLHTFPFYLHRPLLHPPGSDLIPFLIELSLPFIIVHRDVSFGARINMCFRIKLVQRFLTMISQKLSPDNLFGWSRASETLRDGKAVNVARSPPAP